MGSNDLFQKRKAERSKRKREIREPYPDSFLIITEGEKTEPYYFAGLKKIVLEKAGKDNISLKPLIKISGQGKNTLSLINAVDEIVNRETMLFKEVWVVFDKDDFPQFDEAIRTAQHKGYQVAWSNQSFEYWLLLHFQYLDSALHRHDIVQKVNEHFQKQHHLCYDKNDPNVFAHTAASGGLKKALTNAQRIRDTYQASAQPGNCNPCTTVDLLVRKFTKYLSDYLS